MKLIELMSQNTMTLNLKSTTKPTVIKELVEVLSVQGHVSNVEKLYQDVLDREEVVTTGIGYKIALPHAKSRYVNKASVVFGRSDKGVDFNSLDQKKAHLFFLICVPEHADRLHLQVLAMLSRSLMHETFRQKLLNAKSEQEVLNILKEVE